MTTATKREGEPVRVLLVDDDPGLRTLISTFLRDHAFEVVEAANGVAMRTAMSARAFDLVLLDVMMPGEDGLSIARDLTARSDIAVILISALGEETDRIVGLEVGADDYLPKPVSPRELLARMRAVLRRRGGGRPKGGLGQIFLFAGWTCDLARRIVRDPQGVVVSLSHGEFALLRAFLEHPQRVLTRDLLLEMTHGDATEAYDRAIDTKVSRLRRKLLAQGGQEILRTIRNEGYLFVPRVDRR